MVDTVAGLLENPLETELVVGAGEKYQPGDVLAVTGIGTGGEIEYITVNSVSTHTITVTRGEYDPEAPVKHAIRSLLELG
jgi:hypothetical protein